MSGGVRAVDLANMGVLLSERTGLTLQEGVTSGYESSDMKSVFRHSPRPGWEKVPSRRAA
jgi:hypothetical protein